MKYQVEKIITLEMTLTEACWLKSLVQNPLSEKEDAQTTLLRKEFFETLKEAIAHVR